MLLLQEASYLLMFTLLVVPPLPSSDDWLGLARWDEGLAEVSLYDGQLLVYGVPRDSVLELITVREFFDPERLVKTNPGAWQGHAAGAQAEPHATDAHRCLRVRRDGLGLRAPADG